MKIKLIFAALLSLMLLCSSSSFVVFAEEQDDDTEIKVEEMLAELDLSGISELFDELDDVQKKAFGSDVLDFIRRVANGENAFATSSFIEYLLSVSGNSMLSFLPMVFSIVAVVVLINLVSGLRGGFASGETEGVFNFAAVLLCCGIVFVHTFTVISQCAGLIKRLKIQMEAVFPVLFTLMTALGASGSMAIYKPAVAVLAFVITQLVSLVVVPLIIVITVFSAVGKLSGGVKLSGIVRFLSSLTKWIMYSSFFIFLAFLSLKGVTAAVYDNMSVRTAKFALSKYVPVIGGYLSEGLNLVLAGTVIVKNAVGYMSIMLLLVTVAPTLMSLIFLILSLKLAAGMCETLGNDKISGMLTSVSGAMGLLVSVSLGIVFLYFVFMLLLILSGNLVL